jgi:hypothetical protein
VRLTRKDAAVVEKVSILLWLIKGRGPELPGVEYAVIISTLTP